LSAAPHAPQPNRRPPIQLPIRTHAAVIAAPHPTPSAGRFRKEASIMRKVYKLEGSICGNCAAKIQDKINKLDGVNSAKVNFLTLKFTLDADDDKFDDLVKQSVKIFDDIEPTCTVLVK
jgi:copper chaperone CopZ